MKNEVEIQLTSVPNCYLCKAPGQALYTGAKDLEGNVAGTWSFSRCSNHDCGLVWLNPAPLESEIWKAYQTYHTHGGRSGPRLSRYLISLINRLGKAALYMGSMFCGLREEKLLIRYLGLKSSAKGRLLDVGCGGGRYLRRMKRSGWQVEGIDFDEKATARLAGKTGIKVMAGHLIEQKLPDQTYDAITMSHVIEHLYDPVSLLSECKRLLKPGGRLVVVTPNAQSLGAAEFGKYWRGLEPPRHIHIFSPGNLVNCARLAGFDDIQARSVSTDAAIVYRASRMAAVAKTGLLFSIRTVLWSYWKEWTEFFSNREAGLQGNALFLMARKSSTHTH